MENGKSADNGKWECGLLLEPCVGFAERMLREFGEFHPFGEKINSAFESVAVGMNMGEEHPRGRDVEAEFRSVFRKDALEKRIRAAAIVSDVVVRIPREDRHGREAGQGERTDAIQVHVAHIDGFAAYVFYPYSWRDKELTFGRRFASGPAPNFLIDPAE